MGSISGHHHAYRYNQAIVEKTFSSHSPRLGSLSATLGSRLLARLLQGTNHLLVATDPIEADPTNLWKLKRKKLYSSHEVRRARRTTANTGVLGQTPQQIMGTNLDELY